MLSLRGKGVAKKTRLLNYVVLIASLSACHAFTFWSGIEWKLS